MAMTGKNMHTLNRNRGFRLGSLATTVGVALLLCAPSQQSLAAEVAPPKPTKGGVTESSAKTKRKKLSKELFNPMEVDRKKPPVVFQPWPEPVAPAVVPPRKPETQLVPDQSQQ